MNGVIISHEVRINRRYWFGSKALPIGHPLRNEVLNLFRVIGEMPWEVEKRGKVSGWLFLGELDSTIYLPQTRGNLTVERRDVSGEFGCQAPYNIPYSYLTANLLIKDGKRELFNGEVTSGSDYRESYHIRTFRRGDWEKILTE